MLPVHHLNALFEPSSVAVIGASEDPRSVGHVIFHNMLDAGFRGQLYPINPKYETVQGQRCYRSVEEIGGRIDMAVIAAPTRVLPSIIEQCGRSGVRHAVIVTSLGERSETFERRLLETARNAGVRLLGPGSLGIVRPEAKVNAALSRIAASAGDLALVSQSGAMCSVVLDWAAANQVGFSSVISLGSTLDVDFGETLDYLVHDRRTRYILLYVDRIRHARHFMSALRSAARIKPIILLKVGRHGPIGTEPDVAAVADEVFNAAMRRAGVVRVHTIGQLFYAARALAAGFRPRVEPLAIITNGGGPGLMASDRAGDLGMPLVEFSPEVRSALQAVVCSGGAPCANPLHLGGDAPPERYRQAILALSRDPAIENLLVIVSPHAMTDPREIAQAIIAVVDEVRLHLCCCFMGGGQVAEARELLEAAGIAVFRAPETAIELFHHISSYYRGQDLLLQTAGQTTAAGQTRSGSARLLVETLLNQRRGMLSPMEAKSLLRSFGVPITQTMVARDVTEALFVAEQVGFPIVMKIDSPDIPHKSEAGGVRLNLANGEAAWSAFHDILATVRGRHPEARINGVSIEPYLHRPHGRELTVGVFRDPVFGPVIRCGASGPSDENAGSSALALPPLNPVLARTLIEAPPIARALADLPDLPPVDRTALERVLVAVSDLVSELPWVKELEIRPLIVDGDGAIAADARIEIDHGPAVGSDRYAHMAIHPYPTDLVEEWKMSDGRAVLMRPVRSEDAALLEQFFDELSPEARYYRFMEHIDVLPPSMVARFTQIDYDREMALLATLTENGSEHLIGSARYSLAPDGESAEFALVIADAWQRYGLGRRLMTALITCARERGYRTMVGDVLGDNAKMFRLMRSLGFEIMPHPEESSLKRVVKKLVG